MNKLSLCILTLFTMNSFANGVNEDGSWQFEASSAKNQKLQQEAMREKLEGGGFNQNYTINADGASTLYIGNAANNTSNIGQVGSMDSNTAIGNAITVTGDGNSVNADQDASDSDQDAVGTDVVDSGDVLIGRPINNDYLLVK
jgi:preprotein translocase subunit SecF